MEMLTIASLLVASFMPRKRNDTEIVVYKILIV